MRLSRGIAGLACGVAVLVAMPSSAAAAVSCGDTLTHDVKLHEDLDCAGYPSNTLTVGHNGITINLNGHDVHGQPVSDYGIVDHGYDGVTIKNGSITATLHSLDLLEASNVTLSHLDLNLQGPNENYGVYAGEMKHLHMTDVNVDDPYYAYYVYDSLDARLAHSRVTGSDPATSAGVYFGNNTGLHSGEVHDVRVNHAQYGIYVYGATKHFEVTDSMANGAGYAGFYIANGGFSPRKYKVSDNTANGTGDYGFYANEQVAGSNNTAKHHSVKNCRKVNCG
jgi:hypothetical protein